MLKKIVVSLLFSVSLTVTAFASKSPANYLFTQMGKSVVVSACQDKQACDYTIVMKHLTEHEVTYFTDRPKHYMGYMTIEQFVKNWSVGSDSFAKDHPNASFVYFDKNDEARQNIVRLSHPVFDKADGTLSYDIQELGRSKIMPGVYQHPVLFIDWRNCILLCN